MGNPVPVVDVAKNELLLVATHNNTFPMVLSAPLGSNGCEVSVNQNQKSVKRLLAASGELPGCWVLLTLRTRKGASRSKSHQS